MEQAAHQLHLPLWSIIPFVLMLLSIAIFPLTIEHWWENNRNKFIVSLILGIPVGIYFAVVDYHQLFHVGHEYFSFIVLLGALYVISGGIVLRGDLEATPTINLIFLAIGTVLASFMGTTGAAMLLIRPLLKTNKERKHKLHTFIFFTFLVANIGGSLTPLGDPPLFMGYLRGVPFAWTFKLFLPWLFTVGIILAIYFVWDTIAHSKETKRDILRDEREQEKLTLVGWVNFPLLAGVVCAVAFLPISPWRELVMITLAILSWKLTPMDYRKKNEFNFNAILEVAALFFGIFLTMIPALVLLNTRGSELGVTQPWQFFWATGSLSAFLDNTPTYVVFFELAKAMANIGTTEGITMIAGVAEPILIAISLGAVFMGAMTYIGNAPNFMVKVICDEQQVKMPSFFGYLMYSVVILVPVFFLMTLIFIL